MEKKEVVKVAAHIILAMIIGLSLTMNIITLIDNMFEPKEEVVENIEDVNPPKLGDYEDEIIDKISVLTVKNDDGMIY